MNKKITIAVLICMALGTALYAQTRQSGRAAEDKSAKTAKNIPDGYGSLKWGALTAASKTGVLGKIVYTDEKKVIISRDGEIEYLYGFFYVDPAVAAAPEAKDAKDAKSDGRLYYVVVSFPYLALDDVRKKVEAKFGVPTGENIKKNQGAYVWEADKTTVILWVDEYEKKPYTRKLTYVGKDIAKEINDYQLKVFTAGERKVLEGLTP
ncbi:MAG TPA: hypothetical protein PLE73_01690 [Spirochaetota bacterium]|nr:hypothetical protein [Spirochaetota bacterium]HPI21876.1 hypothetical protein [Spirochaetota bacterium]HPU89476.1 hypothetical protein [Spirochaetota bacterium]